MGYQSGQMEQTVNLPAYAYVGSNPTPTMQSGRLAQLVQSARFTRERSQVQILYRPCAGDVAQMGERCNRTAEVRGSIPLSSTSLRPDRVGLRPASQPGGVILPER